MSDDTDTKRVLGQMADELEKHGERISSFLSKAEKKFDADYGKYAAVAGTAFVAASIPLCVYHVPAAFCITLAVIGAVLIILGLVFRHLDTEQQLRSLKQLLELERERSQTARTKELFRDWWLNGPPKGIDVNRLLTHTEELPKLLPAASERE